VYGCDRCPGDTCTVSLRFNPSDVGARRATLAVTPQFQSPVTVDLTGRGFDPTGSGRGGDAVVPVPGRRSECRSQRHFILTLYRGDLAVRRASVTLNGKRVRTSHSGRTARIDLLGHRSGVALVSVRVRLVDGRRLAFTRRYATCVPQRPSS
jgi:hypothetical protein